jgi:hypothetical protein
MAIENQYLQYYEKIGILITPEDIAMSDDKDKIVYVALDHNIVYYDFSENQNAFPVKVKGHEWSILWWMYRLSERKCEFREYLAEYIIPVCRRYFTEERKKPTTDEDDNNRGS